MNYGGKACCTVALGLGASVACNTIFSLPFLQVLQAVIDTDALSVHSKLLGQSWPMTLRKPTRSMAVPDHPQALPVALSSTKKRKPAQEEAPLTRKRKLIGVPIAAAIFDDVTVLIGASPPTSAACHLTAAEMEDHGRKREAQPDPVQRVLVAQPHTIKPEE